MTTAALAREQKRGEGVAVGSGQGLGRIYIITDRRVAAGGDLVGAVAAALSRLPPGSAVVQLREKDLDSRELLALARQLLGVTRPCHTPLLVNDRIDIALAAGADGVHLPEQSFTIEEARELGGADFLVGVSTHSPADAASAAKAGADLILLGHIWPTPSKAGRPPLGVDSLAEAAALVSSSGAGRLYAIGGVDEPERAREARAAGAYGIAGIRGFIAGDDPAAATLALAAALGWLL